MAWAGQACKGAVAKQQHVTINTLIPLRLKQLHWSCQLIVAFWSIGARGITECLGEHLKREFPDTHILCWKSLYFQQDDRNWEIPKTGQGRSIGAERTLLGLLVSIKKDVDVFLWMGSFWEQLAASLLRTAFSAISRGWAAPREQSV